MPRPAATTDPAEVVGLQEIAARLGVAVNTPLQWRKRGARTRDAIAAGADPEGRLVPMPDPDGYVGTAPWWWWTATIVPWADATGRLPEDA